MDQRIKVFITIDTEIWPLAPDWRETGLIEDFRRDIVGRTEAGDFGIHYQMQTLNEHGLKAVFFVEALFADVVGPKLLKSIINAIQDAGHEVQLHLHTDWLSEFIDSRLPTKVGRYMKDFSLEEQVALVKRGVDNLEACGADRVCAFRAGHYGANFDTLRALRKNGIDFDTSYNFPYLNSECDLQFADPLVQPKRIEGVWEIPISYIRDYPGHHRHAQLCALSSREMKQALMHVSTQDQYSFVIVSHSFELLNRGELKGKKILPDKFMLQRFQSLCEFLKDHSDIFETATFSTLEPDTVEARLGGTPTRSSVFNTAGRVLEQTLRRVL